MIDNIIKILDKAVVEDIAIYDMRSITPFYDTCIIGSVHSSRQGNAAVNYLKKEAPLLGYELRSYHAMPDTKWFLVDLNDIVIHIFVGDERQRYNLDGMCSVYPIVHNL